MPRVSSLQMPTSIFRVTWMQWLMGAYLAIFPIMGLWWLFTEPARWNRIEPMNLYEREVIQIGDGSYNSELKCRCPEWVIEGSSASLSFTLTLRRSEKDKVPSTHPTAQATMQADAGNTRVTTSLNAIPDPMAMEPGAEVVMPFKVQLDDVKPDLSQINFRLVLPGSSNGIPQTLQAWTWRIASKPTFREAIIPYFYVASVVIIALCIALWWYRRIKLIRRRAAREILGASARADKNPQVARYAWDLARVKLEAYFDRNLIQVNLVFWMAAIVMVVGFLFVLAGVRLSYMEPDSIRPPLVAAISGIITQFIGATFMVIYRSTMAQATEFMTVLERINSVGMAVQILDSLQDGTELKDKARADLATLLLASRTSSKSKLGLDG